MGSSLALTIIFSQNSVKEIDSFRKGTRRITDNSDQDPLCSQDAVILPLKVNFAGL